MHIIQRAVLVALLFVAQSSFAQDFYKKVINDTTLIKSGKVIKGFKQGLWIFKSPKGAYVASGYYVDGVPDSTWYLYKNNQVDEVIMLRNGQKNGAFIIYEQGTGLALLQAGYKNDKLEGQYTEYHFDGSPSLQGYYANGKKDSLWMEFDEYRRPTFKQRYKNGLSAGEWVFYHSNGQVEIRQYYTNGYLDGAYEENYKSGVPYIRATYQYGSLNGQYKEYFPTGGVSVKGKYESGQKTDVWMTMTETGSVYSIGDYKNDLKHGHWKYFYPSGALELEGQYLHDQKNDQWMEYYESGKLKSIGSFKLDLKNGLWGHFYQNGQLKQDEHWKNGYLLEVSDYYTGKGAKLPKGTFSNGNGVKYTYYADGTLQSEETFVGGEANGPAKYYSDNGDLESQGQYEENEASGTWQYFNKRGKVIREKTF
ncbi:toxin-antitoxin system YwqK family antitoxin [Reichenbachiella agariperforans]|uniref:toxin-antitoxin system YwqK family antitoxin n=1 Tax=Reichenbachiella agariperforans TaxID=156994 RepID=UPI001C080606|nr:toxin-antitoxin system YwqK family antitoxin [Reichenbachiella agariperforans]MBU2915752.1 toxin-antitoxin system YwqK family antitoxin [Reichenbachiella agariperforans]